MRTLFLFAVVLAPALARAETPEEIVRKMDENMTFKTRTADATLTIYAPGKSPEQKGLSIWARGWDETYSIFRSPARDKGVKYLKLEKNLYMYLPTSEKVVKISGHLLRQSLMDSDFSYEDMLEARALLQDYDAKLIGEEAHAGEPCWVVDLNAKRDDVAYWHRKLWISKKSYVLYKSELYAKSGLLLKVMTTEEVLPYGGRYYPSRFVMQDKLKQGTKSVFELKNVKFDSDLPDATFSRRNLMRGD